MTGTGDENRKGISRRGFAGVIGAGLGAGVAANWLYKNRYEARDCANFISARLK